MTDKQTDNLRLKGKPLSFKSRSRGSVDIVIRNVDEFIAFCSQGVFQRQHLSSLIAQVFDPLFNITCIYLSVARLINREILSAKEGVMPMTEKVNPMHYFLLYKLVTLYFRIQFLKLPRYLLVKDVPSENIKNVILAFSDGSAQFSTSCVYLLSYDCKGEKYSVTLVSTLSKTCTDMDRNSNCSLG